MISVSVSVSADTSSPDVLTMPASISPSSQQACKDGNANWTGSWPSANAYTIGSFGYGDGNSEDIDTNRTGQAFQYAFASTLRYNQSLNVTDSSGRLGRASSQVNVIRCN